MKWTIRKFREAKGKQALGCTTAYDFITARMADAAGVPLILVGDSLATTSLGHPTTIPATMDIMVHHAEAVCRAVESAIVVGDLPFLSYINEEDALRNAGRFLQESGCDAVKLEGGATQAKIIRRLVDEGIPVMAHIGLLPQSVKATGYAVRGRKDEDVDRLRADLDAVTEAGAFSVVLECVVPDVAEELTARTPIPTISVGSSPKCDAQFLVLADLLGMMPGPGPKFAKAYAHFYDEGVAAIAKYVQEVADRAFPDAEHLYK